MPSLLFVGVDTANSFIHRAFPIWSRTLGVRAEVVGVDLPPGSAPREYRRVVERVRADPDCVGAVVTSHKVAVYAAASDLFDFLDPHAVACGEISAIRRRGAGLAGFARDPVSVGRVVDGIWPGREGDLLCLGSGGTAIALGRHLLTSTRPDGEPKLMRFVDVDPVAGVRLRQALRSDRVEAVRGEGPWDATIEAARPGSLIVNATGLGKDRPGSPVTPAVQFPDGAVVWELNYRGDLRLLAHARARRGDGRLTVHDGWSLFCHGWASALAAVFDLDDDEAVARRLAADAEHLRA
ncbi:shikimate dehydrogenase [Rugosimonospora acidiphila]|uniref:Shikimate dehydrogenase n=1 Tax=Rugosimonospora acidiphila TaxID=556531 RepID=A0ABP9S1C5_9ACTN